MRDAMNTSGLGDMEVEVLHFGNGVVVLRYGILSFITNIYLL